MKSPVKIATVLLAMAAFAACGKDKAEDDQIVTVRGNLLPDETTPIGQKWRQLVNANVGIGEATAAVQNVPGYPAQYQQFINGVIVFTNDHGAVYLTQAIFNKWQSLTGMTDANGTAIYSYLRCSDRRLRRDLHPRGGHVHGRPHRRQRRRRTRHLRRHLPQVPDDADRARPAAERGGRGRGRRLAYPDIHGR